LFLNICQLAETTALALPFSLITVLSTRHLYIARRFYFIQMYSLPNILYIKTRRHLFPLRI
jgi:hypothetical protein